MALSRSVSVSCLGDDRNQSQSQSQQSQRQQPQVRSRSCSPIPLPPKKTEPRLSSLASSPPACVFTGLLPSPEPMLPRSDDVAVKEEKQALSCRSVTRSPPIFVRSPSLFTRSPSHISETPIPEIEEKPTNEE